MTDVHDFFDPIILKALYDSMYYVGAAALILVGLYMVLVKANLIKILLGITFMDTGIHVLLIAIGYVKGRTAPVFTQAMLDSSSESLIKVVDPLPQAMVLTAIVIGVGVISLGLSIVVNVYRHYGTLDARKIKGLKW